MKSTHVETSTKLNVTVTNEELLAFLGLPADAEVVIENGQTNWIYDYDGPVVYQTGVEHVLAIKVNKA